MVKIVKVRLVAKLVLVKWSGIFELDQQVLDPFRDNLKLNPPEVYLIIIFIFIAIELDHLL